MNTRESKHDEISPQEFPLASDVFVSETSPAYIPPGSRVLVVGPGLIGGLPMDPFMYVLPYYLGETGKLTVLDLPPDESMQPVSGFGNVRVLRATMDSIFAELQKPHVPVEY